MKQQALVQLTCVIAVFLLSSATFGDVYTIGDWRQATSGSGIWVSGNEEHVWTGATADAEYPSSYGGCDGWTETYTTETGQFNWYSYLRGEALAMVTLEDNLNVWSRAWGIASADGPGDSADVWIDADPDSPRAGLGGQVWYDWDMSSPGGIYAEAYDQTFEADLDCVRTECYAVVSVSRHSGAWGEDRADASGEAIAYTVMTAVE